MAKYLVIVESPAKVKTIKKFLGANYEVEASNGHVRDLPKSQLGIDVEHDYEPKYITIRGKGDVLSNLRKKMKKADKIYLATDPDREGEAISWHLYHALKMEEQGKQVQRITFNEITKNAVKASLKEPREIDMNLVDAQQARRMLDRMVGYEISPILWDKVKRGLSAGRVQSAALRMICDREEEIERYIPQEYWSLEADLSCDGEKKPLKVKYYGTAQGKETVESRERMDEILSGISKETFKIREIRPGERTKKPPLPFTTSTLQQEAANHLNFSTQKTMRLAQQLYEGVEIKGHGTVGVITYLRTDSTRVSEEADSAARAYIAEKYGEDYVASGSGDKKSGAKIQDAHEAIRPTNIAWTPDRLKVSLSRDLFRLYQLIWQRFAASRMSAAVYDTVSVKISAGEYQFTAAASKIRFDGYLSVYADEEKKDGEAGLMAKTLTKDTGLKLLETRPEQHFTQPPAHFTEASLVGTLEEQGIGRPSTYAPTFTLLLARRYIAKEGKNIFVTDLGDVVNNMMKEAFPSIVDISFTANLEALLDKVAEGGICWKVIVSNFYPDLKEAVEKAKQELANVTVKDEETEEICENCGRNMVIKYGPHGKFLACPGFPECHNTKPLLEKAGVKCPKCGGEVIIRKSKKGRRFYSCEHSPKCDFISWQKPSEEKCPQCGSYMTERGDKLICSNEECRTVVDKQEKSC